MTVAWALRAVTVGYGTTEVLRHLDLDLPASLVTAVVGPGGSGKTTLLRVLAPPGRIDGLWIRGRLTGAGEPALFLPQPDRRSRLDQGPNWSGRQFDRVDQALRQPPSRLLLDEPADMLEPDQRSRIAARLRQLTGRHTVVCVTHHLGFARDIADHVVFLAEGEMVEAVSVADFFERPRNPRTQDFLLTGS